MSSDYSKVTLLLCITDMCHVLAMERRHKVVTSLPWSFIFRSTPPSQPNNIKGKGFPILDTERWARS